MNISWVVAIIVCFASILVLRPIAVNWGLVDTPDNRKRHVGNIPLTGGVAIYISTITSVSLFVDLSQHINLLLVSISIMVFIGSIDDKYDLSAKLRLIAQTLIALILVFGTGIKIDSLGNLFGLGEVTTGPFSEVITVLAIIAGINAFNMTDGIDGLAGTLSLISLLAIGLVVLDGSIKLIVGVMSSALLVFLSFNLGLFSKKYKIFMGDAGSMMLGLTVSWLLIVISQSEEMSIKPVNVLWFIAVPLVDMIAVMYRRVRRGQSPLVADREHLHHVFMDMGFTPKQALLIISFISLLFGLTGYLSSTYNIPEYISLISFVLIFIVYNIVLTNRHKLKFNK
ncbi:UDP-N-acetylglucosamine--undecaprenyl-phosphate N-acetylglucosaminephosphotransferase [Kangiella japonica]|uniref:Undecaprenyl-phosphate alpha-N-acetylglucosaminyl 1-phosphate transferase n=1 Tax=Kangiella japonica TaxID=647384 RepID=A0ABP3CCV0_9GAMM